MMMLSVLLPMSPMIRLASQADGGSTKPTEPPQPMGLLAMALIRILSSHMRLAQAILIDLVAYWLLMLPRNAYHK